VSKLGGKADSERGKELLAEESTEVLGSPFWADVGRLTRQGRKEAYSQWLLVVEEAPRWRTCLGDGGVGTDKLGRKTREKRAKRKGKAREYLGMESRCLDVQFLREKSVRERRKKRKEAYGAVVRVDETRDVLKGHFRVAGAEWAVVVGLVIAHTWVTQKGMERQRKKSPSACHQIPPSTLGFLTFSRQSATKSLFLSVIFQSTRST